MTKDRVVLITGATGRQGGAVARSLAGKGFKIRAMTRKPDSDAAKALVARGADVVKGDLNDAASLESALTSAWGVFAVQNTWEAGVAGEEEQGKITFVPIPIEDVRKNSEDFALMLEWFDRVGYNVDIGALEREFGIHPTTLEAWAKQRPDQPK